MPTASTSTRRPRNVSTQRIGDVRAAEDPRELREELAVRHRADDAHVEQAVVDDGPGRDHHPARVAAGVADGDEPRRAVPDGAVDRRRTEPARAVHRERAQHGGDVERRARGPLHAVRPPVRLGVEPGVRDGREPRGSSRRPTRRGRGRSATSAPCVEERERVERAAAVDPEVSREVVPRTGRDDRQRAAGLGRDAGERGHGPVAAARDDTVTAVECRRGPPAGRRRRRAPTWTVTPRAASASPSGEQPACPAPPGGRVDDRRPAARRAGCVRRLA